jgi:cytochrome c
VKKSAHILAACALSVLTGDAVANEALANQCGCVSCHKADTKFVGPSYKDIATKYKNDAGALHSLTARVKTGSKPDEPLKWGTVAMPPIPASEANIRTVIQWILAR